MASPASQLALIDAAIEEIVTAMADVDATQTVKIRGREIERVSLESRLDSLVKAREKIAPIAARASQSPFRLGCLGRNTR